MKDNKENFPSNKKHNNQDAHSTIKKPNVSQNQIIQKEKNLPIDKSSLSFNINKIIVKEHNEINESNLIKIKEINDLKTDIEMKIKEMTNTRKEFGSNLDNIDEKLGRIKYQLKGFNEQIEGIKEQIEEIKDQMERNNDELKLIYKLLFQKNDNLIEKYFIG